MMTTHHWTVSISTPDWRESAEFGRATALLERGELVAIPTETVYGLAADATNGQACARIFEAKGRPRFNPLISHVPDYATAQNHGIFNDDADKLAKHFWPGPLTLVVPRKKTSPISELATAGLDTVALRVPASPLMQTLSQTLNRPLAAPSANLSGRLSPTTGADVAKDMNGRIGMVIDTGPTAIGLESSIVACVSAQPVLLRPGGIPAEDISQVLAKELKRTVSDDTAPAAPGMLSSHYAPNALVRMDAREVGLNEGLLAFGPHMADGAQYCREVHNLSEQSDLREAASRLFTGLRLLDVSGVERIAVMPIPKTGLGEAINDRLKRAAAPRK
ncbi:MAG: L-threonylcarbamoyladenylate synthase [Stappiaceae bacterium]